jgi:hypothetical protein
MQDRLTKADSVIFLCSIPNSSILLMISSNVDLSLGPYLNRSIKKLTLRKLNLYESIMANLISDLKSNKILEELTIRGAETDYKVEETTDKVLEVNIILMMLELIRCCIGNNGAKHIGIALKSNRSLLHKKEGAEGLSILHLRNNNLDSEGIGESLKINKTLMELHIEQCNIGNEGAISISETLKVKEIDMNCNSLESEVADSIGEMLKINRTLKVLDLRHNSIGDVQSIEEANSVTLHLSYNEIESIGNLFKGYGLTERLDLRSNLIGDKGAETIAELLKASRGLK